MKILLVSNFYYNRGGDCTYLFSLKKLLEEKGHKVSIFSMHHPQNIACEYSDYFVSYINYDEEVKSKSLGSGIKVLNRTVYSWEAKRKIEKLIQIEKPDIVHLQNIHHHITPSILYVFKKYNIPIIWTLHDFTLICPNTSFLAHGKICEKCKSIKYYWPPIIKCKKNSFGASAIAALETAAHRILKVNDLIDFFVTPSKFLMKKMSDYGFAEGRVVHLKSFVSSSDFNEHEIFNDDYYIYVGRISEEKGIKTLINAAAKVNTCKLKIAGTGPLENEMKSYVKSINANDKIEFLGYQEHSDVMRLLNNCRFAVLPSECYENFPYAVIEAFSCGKSAIGTRSGGIPEIIKSWETGLLFEPRDSDELSLKIKFFVTHPDKAEKMGKVAKTFVEKELNVEKHYQELIGIYERAILKKTVKVKK
jgi:glycosyltransferase involved in cell wall biosynthesis